MFTSRLGQEVSQERSLLCNGQVCQKQKQPLLHIAVAENYQMLEPKETLETIKSRPLISQGMKLKYNKLWHIVSTQ